MNIPGGYNWAYVVIELLGILIWIYVIVKSEKGSEARRHAIGLLLHSFGSAIRIGYWAVASEMFGKSKCGFDWTWSCQYRDFLIIAVILSSVGMSIVLRPFLKRLFGRLWWLIVPFFFMAGFIGGAF